MSKPNDEAEAAEQPKLRQQGQLFREMLDAPLYTRVELHGKNPNFEVRDARVHKKKYDYYCPGCKKVTPWQMQVPSALSSQAEQEDRVDKVPGAIRSVSNWMIPFEFMCQCLRGGHTAEYHFVVDGPGFDLNVGESAEPEPNFLVKTGQYPSLTDFQLGDLTEFEEVISKQQRSEFVRAINCAAHGFAVAACVYYRRVFEGILIEARNEHMAAHDMKDWPEFQKAHTDVRIKMLAENLPKFLIEHPHLYSVLSLGVHELTEEECGEQLPMLRMAIELILRDRIAVVAAQKQREAVSKLLAQAVDKHK
jgi:hypothetical protein